MFLLLPFVFSSFYSWVDTNGSPKDVPKTIPGSELNKTWYFTVLPTGLRIKGTGTPPECHRGHLVSPLQPDLASTESLGSYKAKQHQQAAAKQPDNEKGPL